MPKRALCMKCSLEFASEADYQKHKDAGHTGGGTPIAPSGQTVPAEFIAQVERIENKDTPPVAPTELPAAPVVAPIGLSYVYTGSCPSCNVAVSTLELDIEVEKAEQHVVVAFCPNCKKQLQTRKVEKL